jgi:hypothetical protein
MFMNGLGPVTPQVADGAGAPVNPVSSSVEFRDTFVFLDDGQNFGEADVLFAGLAPGFAGLYQVNFTLPPSGLSNGHVQLDFETIEGLNEMSTISVSGFSTRAFVAAPLRRGALLRSHPLPARVSFGRPLKNFRRALPAGDR